MDNQHQKIKGYRDLSQAEIDLMNKIKAHGEATKQLCAEVRAHVAAQFEATNALPGTARTPEQQAEWDRLIDTEAHRWVSIAITDFQTAVMALVRAVAQPTSF